MRFLFTQEELELLDSLPAEEEEDGKALRGFSFLDAAPQHGHLRSGAPKLPKLSKLPKLPMRIVMDSLYKCRQEVDPARGRVRSSRTWSTSRSPRPLADLAASAGLLGFRSSGFRYLGRLLSSLLVSGLRLQRFVFASWRYLEMLAKL